MFPDHVHDEKTITRKYASRVTYDLGANATATWAVADRLALAEGTYAPFVPRGPLAATFGRSRG